MVLIGHVKDDVITIDNKNIKLPDGIKVEIIPLVDKKEPDTVCGSWKDDRSAQDIIKDLKKSRNNRESNKVL